MTTNLITFHLCECSKVATIKKHGEWLCERCDRIERMNLTQQTTVGFTRNPALTQHQWDYTQEATV